MAYDEGLAERLRDVLRADDGIKEKKMFGGLAFMSQGHMFVGIIGDDLMVRTGPDRYEDALRERHVRVMDFTGKPMKGYVFIAPEGFESDTALAKWVRLGKDFVQSLPSK